MQLPGFTVSLDLEALPWRPTRFHGVRWLRLAEVGGDQAVLIQMDPGSSYPPHRHRGIEEVLVLQGGYRDELGLHQAGAYLRYDAESVHTPVAVGDSEAPVGPENPACLLFASARGGVENLGHDAG